MEHPGTPVEHQLLLIISVLTLVLVLVFHVPRKDTSPLFHPPYLKSNKMLQFTPQKRERYVRISRKAIRKYHIEDLNLIVEILYPRRRSINKYKRLLEKQTDFNEGQKELVLQTAHSLTVINELYRDRDKYDRLYTCREDVFNAIFMVQNELNLEKAEYLLSPNLRWFYKMVKGYYGFEPFTARQVREKMLSSKTNVYNRLSELVDRNLLEIIGHKGQAFVYKIV